MIEQVKNLFYFRCRNLILLLFFSYFFVGCEIFTIGSDATFREPQIELTRQTPLGTSLLYLEEIRRKNLRAVARMHITDNDSFLLPHLKNASTIDKKFALMSKLALVGKKMKYSKWLKADVLKQEEDFALTRVITERSDTLLLNMLLIDSRWYVSEYQFHPYKID